MVIIRGMYEITELVAGCIGSVVLYIAGCNVVSLQYIPDFPAALFVLSSVILIHHWRVLNYPPVQQLWSLLLELVGLYIATQVMVAFMWEEFHALIDFIRDALLYTNIGMRVLKTYPRLIMFMRQDVCYLSQVLLSVLINIKVVGYTKALDYVYADRRVYQYRR